MNDLNSAPSTTPNRSGKARQVGVALGLLALAGSLAAAPHITEPDTVVYGRVVQRLGGHEFLATEGELVWTVHTTGPAARDYRLTARLSRLADGTYSYRLRIPHQVRAYNLAVADGRVGLGAASSGVQHVSATLDGKLLTVAPGVVDGFALSQASRAAAWRLDFEIPSGTAGVADSDGDGLPDWWEDANGFDKWDPTDAAKAFAPATVTPPTAGNARTLAEWRTVHFPKDTRDLDVFGADDPDHDGISNLQEYAFDLDPNHPDPSSALALPHLIWQDTRMGLAYRPRSVATDLSFQVEVSNDLFAWRNGAAELEPAATLAASGASVLSGQVGVVHRDGPQAAQSFLRVRIVRH